MSDWSVDRVDYYDGSASVRVCRETSAGVLCAAVRDGTEDDAKAKWLSIFGEKLAQGERQHG